MEQLLKQLLGQDNAMRSHAEQTISELETQPERYMMSLMNVPIRSAKGLWT